MPAGLCFALASLTYMPLRRPCMPLPVPLRCGRFLPSRFDGACAAGILPNRAAGGPAATAAKTKEKGIRNIGCLKSGCGNYLTFRGREPQVLSAQESLTSVFGMRTGGSSPLSSPQWLYIRSSRVIYLSAHAGFFPPASALPFAGGFPRLPYQSLIPRLTTA